MSYVMWPSLTWIVFTECKKHGKNLRIILYWGVIKVMRISDTSRKGHLVDERRLLR